MNIRNSISTLKARILALMALLFLSACGGGSDTTPVVAVAEPTTGMVGLFFTDAPTDEFSAIKLNVVEAILIGGNNSQQVLFQGSEPIDLLDLTNFNEPIIFGEVEVGTYTKLRLKIDDLELVPHEGDSIFPALPANGKIDLLDASGFAVLPGRTLMVEIDMDANKSIKITGAGNGRKYNFRPVVKAKFMDGGLPHKLARVEGSVGNTPADGSFMLCDIDSPDSCVTVMTDGMSSIFDNEGLATGFDSLAFEDLVVVIGRYATDPDIVLNALVLEIGGNAEQVKGNVVSDPMDSQFLLLDINDADLVVELQPGTRYFDADGEIMADAIVLGVDIEVEGVKPAKADPTDPDLMRAALIFLEAEEDEQISGTIAEPLASETRSFDLTLTEGGTTCVRVNEDADILLVDEANSEVTMGEFADLAVDQSVDLFGMTSIVEGDDCFDANEVIVEVVAP
jgi:hypothetical protein